MQKYGLSDFRISIVFAVLSIFGFFLITKINLRLNPVKTGATIYISYSLPGASPDIIDKDISSIIEEKISVLNGIEQIESHSFSNHGYLSVVLDKYTDVDKMRLEIATAIRQVKNYLPKNVLYPQVSLHDPSDDNQTAFLVYQINANRQAFTIKKIIDKNLVPSIRNLAQVDKVVINGYRPLEYLIEYDKKQLERLQISIQQIEQAIQHYFDEKSLGNIQIHQQNIIAEIDNFNGDDWHIPITKKQGRIIYLTDIARIEKREQPTTAYHRINGKNTLSMSIYPVQSANTIVLQKQIEKIISQQQHLLPDDIQLIKTYDSTEFLQSELHKIYKRTFWVVVILLLFVLLVYRSVKYFFIIVLSLLANLGIAFLLYYFFDIQIQLYSLAGITISFGLVMDNSIVMIDHLKHYRNSKVFLPVLASTMTTIAALLVIFFLKDEIKRNLLDFAYVIIINLFVSLIVALLLIPALVRQLNFVYKNANHKYKQPIWQNYYQMLTLYSLRYKKLLIVLIILLFGLPVFMLPQKVSGDGFWAKTYNTTLGNVWYIENVRPYVDKYLGGSLRLFSHYVFESSYYKKNEETKLYVLAQMPKGSNLDQMNEVFLLLDNYLQQFNQIKTFKTDVYQSGFAQIEIVFSQDNSAFAYQLKSMLIRKALNWGGVRWNIYGVGKGFNNSASTMSNYNFQIESVGYNDVHLSKWIDTLTIALKHHPRINEINVSSYAYPRRLQNSFYKIRLNEPELAAFNLSYSQIWNEVRGVTQNLSPSMYVNFNNYNIPIRLQSVQSTGFDIWQLLNYPFFLDTHLVKLKQFASVELKKSPLKIYKKNQEYIKYINVQYTGSHKFGRKVIQQKIDSLQQALPLGIRFDLRERNYYFSKDAQNYYYLLLLVIVLIWGISMVFFESVKQSLLVISLIPISFIGIFLIFYLFDFNFDQGGIAGFILVSGITVNAVYYILNDYNYLRKKHLETPVVNLYTQAFSHKIFPILLTILSTILGFIPFIIDGQNEVFWFSLAIATIGGLLFSLIGIFIYLPVLSLKK
jgi:multidrug efflux pump subunit AcrB